MNHPATSCPTCNGTRRVILAADSGTYTVLRAATIDDAPYKTDECPDCCAVCGEEGCEDDHAAAEGHGGSETDADSYDVAIAPTAAEAARAKALYVAACRRLGGVA